MRQKTRKQRHEDAEREYYEKQSRQNRWHTIKRAVEKLSSQLKGLQWDYCECSRCSAMSYNANYLGRYREFPPDYEGYCERCSEESRMIHRLIDEMSVL